jgi:hypothetical protein
LSRRSVPTGTAIVAHEDPGQAQVSPAGS